MKRYFDEFVFWFTVAVGILFITIPAKQWLKILASKTGNPGLQEAVAS